ncbi:MAG: ISL3 family transposase [Bacteroidetes bacterium]|nr:ISL3 family transposase [Bacteroidota bacterium]
MDNIALFSTALGLQDPWQVAEIEFIENSETNRQELHIRIVFTKGAKFTCTEVGCGERELPVHDTKEKTWRHMNFFQYKCYIHARVPRIICPNHKVRKVEVPWGRKESGFTLLMEAYLVEMVKVLSVRAVAQMLEEQDTKLWRLLKYYVEQARLRCDFSLVEELGVDEYSHRGQHYLTLVIDHNQGAAKVIYCTEGRDSATIKQFSEDFLDHNGDPEKIRLVTCDMSRGYETAVTETFRNAKRVIDKFHVIKNVNDVVDDVRRRESRQHRELKHTRYVWLKNPGNLTGNQQVLYEKLSKTNLRTVKAYQMRLVVQDIYMHCPDRESASSAFDELCSWIMHSNVWEMKKIAKMIRRNKEAILNYFDLRITNAVLEGINSIVALIKRRARGFRNMEYFKTMIYLVCGKMNLNTVPLR